MTEPEATQPYCCGAIGLVRCLPTYRYAVAHANGPMVGSYLDAGDAIGTLVRDALGLTPDATARYSQPAIE